MLETVNIFVEIVMRFPS